MSQEAFYWAIDRFYGLHLDQSSRTLRPGDAIVAMNVDLKDLDVLKGRLGLERQWNPGAIQGLKAFQEHILFCTSSTLYNRGVELKSSWGGWFSSCEISQWCYMANGSSFIRTDGSDAYEVGMTAPVVGSLAAAGSGSDSFEVGDWDYVVTYMDDEGFESNTCSSITTTSTGAGKAKCALTGIPLGDSTEGVSNRKIYRTEDGGSVFYLLDTIEDNTTTTYDDTTTDANLGVTTFPTNHDKPETELQHVATAGGRWFGAKHNSRILYFSLPFPNERAQPSTYFMYFPEYIKAVISLGFSVLVICDDGPYVLRGLNDPDQFYYQALRGPRFYTRAKSVSVKFRTGAVAQGSEGLYFMNDVEASLVSRRVGSLFAVQADDAVTSTTPEVLYLAMRESSFSQEKGTIVALDYGGDTAVFQAGQIENDKEHGIVVEITNDDVFNFSSQYGIVVSIGSTGAQQVIIYDTRHAPPHEPEFYRWDIDVHAVGYDSRTQTTYLGDTVGVHSLTGDRAKFDWQCGHSYLGHPSRYKWLEEVYFGYISGTVILEVYVDGASMAAYTSKETYYCNDTTIDCNNTTIGANGQTIRSGRIKLTMPHSLSGITFSIKLDVVGEIHAPITFKGTLGEFV